MTAPAPKQQNSLLSAPEIMPLSADRDPAVFDALQEYCGRRLLNFSTYERRDFTGYASNKVRVGGALVVECSLLDGDTFVRDTIEINDNHRPFTEDIITSLAQDAPVWVRDIANH